MVQSGASSDVQIPATYYFNQPAVASKSGLRFLSWRLMKWWLQMPPFKGRDRAFCELVNWLVDPVHQVVTQTKDGFRMKLDLADEIDAEVYLFGNYDPATSICILSLIEPGDCVIDAGANIGYLSLLCASVVGARGIVVAFEPSPVIYRRLVTNTRLNPTCSITTVNRALGARAGQGILVQEHRERSGDAMVTPSVEVSQLSDPAAGFARYIIDMDTIDRYCEKEKIVPTLIKVDVEGSDFSVLSGGESILRTALPMLILEFNAASARCFNYRPIDMAQWLSETFGYQFFSITENGLQTFTALNDPTLNTNVIAAILTVHGERIRRAHDALAVARPRQRPREVWALARIRGRERGSPPKAR